MKLREEYEARAKAPYPWTDRKILWDDEDAFSYESANGTIVGYNRNIEIMWRNLPDDTETGDV